jgi:hypothetical protein
MQYARRNYTGPTHCRDPASGKEIQKHGKIKDNREQDKPPDKGNLIAAFLCQIIPEGMQKGGGKNN